VRAFHKVPVSFVLEDGHHLRSRPTLYRNLESGSLIEFASFNSVSIVGTLLPDSSLESAEREIPALLQTAV
jgi:hypothetical protein